MCVYVESQENYIFTITLIRMIVTVKKQSWSLMLSCLLCCLKFILLTKWQTHKRQESHHRCQHLIHREEEQTFHTDSVWHWAVFNLRQINVMLRRKDTENFGEPQSSCSASFCWSGQSSDLLLWMSCTCPRSVALHTASLRSLRVKWSMFRFTSHWGDSSGAERSLRSFNESCGFLLEL